MHIRLLHRLAVPAAGLLMTLGLAGVSGAVTPPSNGTFLYLQSTPGDPIGRGEELLYTDADSGFTMWYINGYFEARVQTPDNFWIVHMEAGTGSSSSLVPRTETSPFGPSTAAADMA